MEVTYVDIPQLAETFSDRTGNSTVDPHHVRVELLVTRPGKLVPGMPIEANSYPVARLVLPIPNAIALHRLLGGLLNELVQRGVLKPIEIGPETKQ